MPPRSAASGCWTQRPKGIFWICLGFRVVGWGWLGEWGFWGLEWCRFFFFGVFSVVAPWLHELFFVFLGFLTGCFVFVSFMLMILSHYAYYVSEVMYVGLRMLFNNIY